MKQQAPFALIASLADLLLDMLPVPRPTDASPLDVTIRRIRFEVALKGRLAEMANNAPWTADVRWPSASEEKRQAIVRAHVQQAIAATSVAECAFSQGASA